MAKDPAFLFYPNDWIGGTMGMSFEEKGVYMELLMMQFNLGHMDGRMIGQQVGQAWDKVRHKFKQDANGLWYNTRLEEEKEKRKNFCESRRNNVSGVNQHTEKPKITKGRKGGHTSKRMEDVNVNEVIDYFVSNNYTEETAKKFFSFYSESNWRDSNNKPVVNWKQKARGVWFKPENEAKNQKVSITLYLSGQTWNFTGTKDELLKARAKGWKDRSEL
mgnify:FL=1